MAHDNIDVTHVMIDIETLGTAPGSVIASIGAVSFTPKAGAIVSEFYRGIDICSAQRSGLTIDAATVIWWLQQSDDARIKTFFQDTDHLSLVLGDLSIWVASIPGPVRVWGHGPSFDLVLLEAAYRAVGMPAPWKFWDHRDTRTIFELSGVSAKSFFEKGDTAHNALDDAKAQARAVIAAYNKLGLAEVAHASAT
jgi:hypothetical protein